MIGNGLDLGVFPPGTPIPVRDINGIPSTLPASRLRLVLVLLGLHYAGLEGQAAAS